jgi:nitronate monooxygenase
MYISRDVHLPHVKTPFTELVRIEHPIVQAPMAGGAGTVELAAAVSEAGGLGSIAGAGLSADALRGQIRALRTATSKPFAVNLFAPLPPVETDPDTLAAARRVLEPHAAELGLALPEEVQASATRFENQIAVVAEEHVPVFSFTFGIPPLDALDDVVVLGTANSAAEAEALEQAGVHVVVAQGAEAGGHRGTFIGSFEDGLVPLAELLPAAVERVGVPVLAAGGLADGAEIAAMLALGAAGAQLGTAFLFTPESGAGAAWRAALRSHDTFVSAAYTGRPARGARTPFLAELDEHITPAPYGVQRALLDPFRSRDGYGWYLGGTAATRARELPAGELVQLLARETESALAGT